jgi:alpha-beta hydrolase superfamily lysophospholipase
MGGLVGLEILTSEPLRFYRAIFTSPMWRFAGALPTSVIRLVARAATALGRGADFAVGEGPFSLRACLEMRRGSDETDIELMDFVQRYPELLRGGSTSRVGRRRSDDDATALSPAALGD